MRLRDAACALAICILASSALGQGITVGAGAEWSMGDANLDLGEGDLAVAGGFGAGSGLVGRVRDLDIQPGGALQGGSATIEICGDWTNAGTFDPGTGRVRFVDGCGRTTATILGSSSYFDLEIATSSAKAYAFEAGQTTTVSNSLTLAGVSGNRLRIESTSPGGEAFLDLQGSQSIAWIEVQDNHAVGDPIELGPDSESLGNTTGWIELQPAVPALGLFGVVLLGVAIALTGWRAQALGQKAP